MYLFELKRFIKSKKLYLSIGAIIVILLFNLILEKAFHGNEIPVDLKLYNIYNSFSQFAFIVFAPIIGNAISHDFEMNYINFYHQNNISMYKYYFTKFILYITTIVPIVILSMIVLQSFFHFELQKFNIILITNSLNMIYTISVGLFLSLLLKKNMISMMGMIFFWFCMSILNVLPIHKLGGFFSSIDTNSFTTYYISDLLNQSTVSMHLEYFDKITNGFIVSNIVIILWTSFFIFLSLIVIKKGKRQYV